ASVSLVVGGIGIMNIMLVSVTERTREIGLRMAVGARGRDNLAEFLGEAVTLSLIGGLIGILIGAITSIAVGEFAGWRTELGLGAVLLAFGFAAAIGVFFGFYPARQAARPAPIPAPRHEWRRRGRGRRATHGLPALSSTKSARPTLGPAITTRLSVGS